MPTMTGGQALVAALKAEGIEVIFGLPGVQIMHIFDALYNEPEISLITTRHEQTTTFMADGYARISGKVPAALVVPGPGVLNAGAGLATAYANSSPILLVSGQVPSTDIGRDVGALGDAAGLFQHVEEVVADEGVAAVLRRAGARLPRLAADL